MGWKTITGSIIFGIGYTLKALSGIFGSPELDQLGDLLIGIGGILGGVGVRAAIKNK